MAQIVSAPQGYDGVARSAVPQQGYVPTPSGITQIPQGDAYSRIQQINSMAESIRAQRAAQAGWNVQNQQQQEPSPQLFTRYSPEDPGGIQRNEPPRQMNPLEQGIAYLGNNVSEGLSGLTGWKAEEGWTPENIAKFMIGLPFQMAGGMAQAPANFASAITGNQYIDNPYTEELEVDADKGLITTDQLDVAQRFAQGMTGVINTGLFGATGQAVRAFTPWFRSVGKVARTILPEASQTVKTAASIGGATAEEAGEEFLQSYLDDISFNHLDDESFDRAAEASKWGALGGAAFSAGAHGVRAFREGRKANQASPATTDLDAVDNNSEDQIQDVSEYYQKLQESGGSFEYMPNVNSVVRDVILNRYVSRTPGSMILKHAHTDYRRDPNTISVSDEDIVSTYERSSNEGQAVICNAFKSTKEEMANAIYKNVAPDQNGTLITWNNRADAIKNLMMYKTNGRGAKVALMRNPDTKNGGFYVDITDITTGGDLQVHPAVYSLFGADVDGDTSVLYFNPDIANVGGYASEIGVNAEGRANYDEKFLAIRYGLDREYVKDSVKKSFRSYSVKDSTIDHIVDTFMDGYSKKGSFSTALNDVLMAARDASKASGLDDDQSARFGRKAYADFLHSVSDSAAGAYKSTWAPRTAVIIKEELRKQGLDDARTWADLNSQIEMVDTKGALGSGTLPVDIYDFIGFVTYTLTTKGNIIFRQYGEAGFQAKSVNAFLAALDGASKLSSNSDVFTALIRSSFRMVTEGVSPTSATEGMFQTYVIAETVGKWGQSKRLKTEQDVNEFLTIFKDAYNNGVEMYNKAMGEVTTEGFSLPFDAIEKIPLKDENDIALGRQFGKIFANMPIDMVFDTSLDSSRIGENLTFEQFIDSIARQGGMRTYQEALTFGDEAVQKFVNTLVNSWKSEKKVVSAKAKKFLKELNFKDLMEKRKKGVWGDLEFRQFQTLMDAVALVIDPEVAFEAGLFGEEILDTKLGQMITGEVTDSRLNAAAGINLNQLYRSYQNMLNNGDDDTKAGALQIINERSEISDIHMIISQQLMSSYDKDGNAHSALLDYLTDPTITWEQKENNWNKLDLCGGITAATDDLFFDCLMSQSSEFDISGMSLRLRKADSVKNNYEKLLYDNARREVAILKEKHRASSGDRKLDMVEFFNYLVKNARVSIDIDVLGAKAYASAVLVNAQMEKGTNEDAGTLSYQMIEQLINGAMVPYMNQIMGETHGVSAMQSFADNRMLWLRILSDRDFKHDLYDISTDTYTTISFDALMKDVDSGWRDGQEMTTDHVWMLFDKYPMLADMLSDVKTQAVQSDATTGSIVAKSSTLSDIYDRYAMGTAGLFFDGTDTLVSLQEELRMQEISNILVNWNDYMGYLIRAAGDDIETTSSIRVMNEEIRKTHNKFVRGIHTLMLEHPQGLNAQQIIKMYFSSIVDNEVNFMNNAFASAISMIDNMFDETQVSNNVLATVGDTLLTALGRTHLNEDLRQLGFDFGKVPVVDPNQDNDAVAQLVRSAMDTKINASIDQCKKIFTLMFHMYAKQFEVSGLLDLDTAKIRKEYYSEFLMQAAAKYGISPDSLQKYLDGEFRPNRKLFRKYKDASGLYAKWSETIERKMGNRFDFRDLIDEETIKNIHILTIGDINKLEGTLSIENDQVRSDAQKKILDPIKKRAIEIAEESEIVVDESEIIDMWDDALDDLNDGNGIRSLQSAMSMSNGVLFEKYLRDVRAAVGSDFNINMITDMNDTIDSLNRLFARLASKLPILESNVPFKHKRRSRIDTDLPVMNFGSSRRQAMVSNMKMVEKGSRASTQVGVNGSQTKMYAGFGFLNPRENNDAPSRTEKGDFILNFTEFTEGQGNKKHKESTDRWACTLKKEGEELHGGDVVTMKEMRRRIQADPKLKNADIRFWHPNDNAHGIYDLCSPLPPNRTARKYNRLGSIIGMLQDDSQESMVLKAKKKFISMTDLIVEERDIENSESVIVDPTKLSNVTDMFTEMRSVLFEARRDYAAALEQVFKENHKANDLGYDAARILAQAFTPAFKLVLSDGTRVFLDVEHLFIGPENLESAIQAIAGDRTIIGASLKFATPEEISARIMRNVATVDEKDFGNKKIVNRVAANAVKSWDGIRADSMSISRLMANINPMGYAHSNGIVAENSRTPVQAMVSSMFNSNFGTVPTPSYKIGEVNALTKEQIENALAYSVDIGDYHVMKAFIPKSWSAINNRFEAANEVWKNMRHLVKKDINGYIDHGVAFVDSTDAGNMRKAVEWAVSTGNNLVMGQDIADMGGFCSRAIVERYAVGDSTMVVVDPTKDAAYRAIAARGMKAKTTHMDADDIIPTFIDDEVLSFDDDGNPVFDRNGKQKKDGTTNGIFGLGDAELIGWGRAGKITVRRAKYTSMDASTILGKSLKPYRILTKSEVDELFGGKSVDQYVKDNGKEMFDFRNRDLRPDVLKNRIHSYVEMIQQVDGNTDGILKGGVRPGDVIAILTNGDKFTPIMMPDNATRDIEVCGLNLIGSTIQMYWSGTAGVGGEFNDRVKMAIDGEAFKGELMMAAENQIAPKMYGCNNEEVVMAASGETQSSRAGGKTRGIFLLRDLWYYCKYWGVNAGYSYMYDASDFESKKGGKEKPKLRENITRAISARYVGEKTYEGALNDFIHGTWEGAWNDFRLGILNMFDTGDAGYDARMNIIIQKVLSSAYMYGIDPRVVFDMAGVETAVDLGRRTIVDTNFSVAFKDLSMDEILLFFNGMDKRICPRGMNDTQDDVAIKNKNTQPVFNRFGKMKVELTLPDGSKVTRYCTVRWGPLNSIGDESASRIAGHDSAYPFQHLYRRGLDYGYIDSELDRMVKYSKYLLGDPSFFRDQTKLRVKEANERARGIYGENVESTLIENILSHPNDSLAQIRHQEDIVKHRKSYLKFRNVVDGGTVLADPWGDQRVKEQLEYFNSRLERDHNIPFLLIECASKRLDGHMDLDTGVNDVSITRFASSIREIADNIVNYGVPVRNKDAKGKTLTNRFAMPELSPDEVDMWWSCCKTIRDRWGTKDKFIEEIHRVSDEAKARIAFVEKTKPAKARALYTAFESDERTWGRFNPSESKYLYGGLYIFDEVNARNELVDALMQGNDYGEPIDADHFNELCDREMKMLSDINNIVENSDRFKNASIEKREGKLYLYLTTQDDKAIARVLNNATELAQVMALLNPNVMVGNMLDRFIHQKITQAALWAARRFHVGPYVSKYTINQESVRRATNDELFIKLYVAYRMAAFDGNELNLLASMSSPEQVSQWLDERMNKMNAYQKFCERIYGLSSGGNKFIKTQMENFINRFVMLAGEEGQEFWFAKTPDGVSRIEDALLKNPAKWFADVLGGNQGKSPSVTIALQAMNWAKTGDMAQRNVLSMMYENAVRNRPLPKFIVTTMVSRFPQYSINIAGRMLNWIMPISSINYVFTNMVAERAHQKAEKKDSYIDPHYERAQIHRSLREAMLVDITHLGVTAVGAILVAMSGGIEPPEDEKKWGNIDEWTVCGVRVGEAWWMEDILGMALPSAAFAKAMMMGKPRFDILMNGCTQVMYNNPVIKVADVVGFLADPEGHIMTDYAKDYKDYENALGGPPSIMDWIDTTTTSVGLNWLTQFFTPSLVKEWWRAAQGMEPSYKTIFEENEYGQLTEEGAKGEAVMKTTYKDAMLRRATRRNPILGWLCDITMNPNTSYSAPNMPRTRYLDDAQLSQMEKWSIKDLDPEAAEAKLFEIMAVMQSYDDMNELRATGFFLDGVTRDAMASLTWDIVNELKNWYDGLQADGLLDYNAYDSFSEGQKAVAEIRQYYNSCKKYFTDFYYNKLSSPALSEPMVVYNRYNTTYATDVNGDIYATGMRPNGIIPFQGILPFEAAPGTLSNPEGTGGWSEDWGSISAVTGLPMDQRALIPVQQDAEDMPSLEDWADENSSGGYSKLYELWHGNGTPNEGDESTGLGKLTGLPISNGKYPKSTSGSKSYGRSYGGGGGGRRGGGGGGYSSGSGYPTIRSNWSAPNLSSPYVMDRVNRRSTQFDYLRPAFETKGSREAYKREDI